MKHIKTYLSILLLFVFCFEGNSQNLIVKNDKGWEYGLFNTETNKWSSNQRYNSAYTIYDKDADGNKTTNGFIVSDKKGYYLLDKHGKQIGNETFESINQLKKDIYIVQSNRWYQIYKKGQGVQKQLGLFDSYQLINGSLYQLRNTEKFYMYDAEKNELVNGEFDAPLVGDGNIVITKKKNKYGIFDYDGRLKVDLIYDSLIPTDIYFCNSYFAKLNGKWGMLSETGEITIPIIYDAVDDHMTRKMSKIESNCIERVAVKINQKWGIVNFKNEWKIKPEYDSILSEESKEVYRLMKNGKTGLVNEKNEIIFPFKFTYFQPLDSYVEHPYKSNLKKMLVNEGCVHCDVQWREDGKWGITDSLGNILVAVNASIVPIINNEFAYGNTIDYSDTANIKLNRPFVDSAFIGYLWNIGGIKSENLIRVDSIMTESADAYGEFQMVTILDYKYSYNFEGGKNGVISFTGDTLIPIEFEDLGLSLISNAYSEGITVDIKSLKQKDMANGVIFQTNKKYPFFGKRNGKWGMYNWRNQEIIKPSYDSIKYERINNPYLMEMSDSLMRAYNANKRIIKAFDNGNTYYFTMNGKLLHKQLSDERSAAILNFEAPYVSENYNFFDGRSYQIIHKKAHEIFYSAQVPTNYWTYTEWGEEIYHDTIINKLQFSMRDGTFNLLNTLNFKYYFPQAIEDLIIFKSPNQDAGINTWVHYLNNPNFVYSDKLLSNPEIAITPSNAHELKEDLSSIYTNYPYFFYKLNNKWYKHKHNETLLIDSINGLDSVRPIYADRFIAYKNGQHGYYNIDFKGSYEMCVEKEIPEFSYGEYRIACNNCEVEYKKILQEYWQYNFDELGNEMEPVLAIDTAKVPLLIKGKLNILNDSDKLVFNTWYDDIKIPYFNETSFFSVTDTNSIQFNRSANVTRDYSEAVKAYQKSVAVKENGKWKLFNVNTPNRVVEQIDEIKEEPGIWLIKKDGKWFEYNSEDLWSTEPKERK